MVARSTGPWQGRAAAHWRTELARAYTEVETLLAALALRPDQVPDLDPTAGRSSGGFRLLVPRGFAALMTTGDPRDPLLRQVLPLGAESLPVAGYVADPVGDGPATRVPGLIQKYRGRALLMAHGACAVHCRYCFRRHSADTQGGGHSARLAGALEAIGADPSISELILSGGDPLMLDDAALAGLFRRLGEMPHLRRLRLHTRLPVVLPERVDEGLCALLSAAPRPTVLVIHVNHPRELGGGVPAALARLAATGITLLNQGVLLAGVNDDADTLAMLSERLFDLGVLPYYLHQLDLVQGAAHFAVPDRRARALHAGLRERLPGYLVPRLVREVAGDPAKRPLV
jgi:EF-P beta-lysylation protein EpmB